MLYKLKGFLDQIQILVVDACAFLPASLTNSIKFAFQYFPNYW